MFFRLDAPDGTAVYPIHDDGREARWSHSPKGVEEANKEGRLIWKKRDRDEQQVWIPYIREYAPETPQRPHPTILLDVKTSRQAKAHQRELLPGAPAFDTVKPEQLLQRILDIATNPGDLVLDSFLGSGTAAAVAHKMGRRYIGIEMGEHAVSHGQPRLQKVVDGEQGGISEAVGWQGGGGFRFYRLGPPVFDENGQIREGIGFDTLAAHIWFSETRIPWRRPAKRKTALGVAENGVAIALLYNGILGDRSVAGGNVLTRATLTVIRQDCPKNFTGKLLVYGERCTLSDTTLKRENITFKQTPYDVKARA